MKKTTKIFIVLLIAAMSGINFNAYSQCRWVVGFPDNGASDKGNDVATDGNGDTYITGQINGHMFVSKVACDNPDNIVWTQVASGTGTSVGQSIVAGPGYVIVSGIMTGTQSFGGSTNIYSSTDGKIFVTMYASATGVLGYIRQDGKLNSSIAGSDIYKALIALNASAFEYYITGSFKGGITMASTNNYSSAQNPDLTYSIDVFVAKYNNTFSNPTFVTLNYTNSPSDEQVEKIILSNGKISIVGEYEDKVLNYPGLPILYKSCDQNGYLITIDPIALGGLAGYSFSSGFSAAATGTRVSMTGVVDDGINIYVSGNYSGSYDLYAAYDLTNNFNVINAPQWLPSFFQITSFVAQIDPLAQSPNPFVLWAVVPATAVTGNNTVIYINDLVKHSGNLYIGGFYSGGAAQFGSNALPQYNTSNAAGRDAFIASLDLSGINLVCKSYGGLSDEEVIALAPTNDCPIRGTGYYQGSTNFNTEILTSASSSKDPFAISDNLTGNPTFAISYGSPTVTVECAQLSTCSGIQLTATPFGLGTYTWNPPLSTTSSIVVTNSATVTVTSPAFTSVCNCGNSAVLHFTGIPNITVSSNVTICEGQSTTLTAGGDASTYTWSPSTGLSSTTGSSVSANPTTNTTYTVTGTNNAGCSSTATITVTVLHVTPPVITGLQNNCDLSGVTQYSVQSLSGYQYNWSINNMTIPATSFPITNLSQISVDYTGSSVSTNPTSGELCVTAIDMNTSYQCSLQVCLPIYKCCASCKGATTGTYFYVDNTNAGILLSLTSPFPQATISGSTIDLSSVSDPKVVINGILDLNQSITFKNFPQICFAPQAKITVQNGSVFTLQDCDLLWAGCDAMWDGIYVEQGGQLIVNPPASNMGVWDAQNAVVSDGGGDFVIQGSNFSNNNKGIVVNVFPGTHNGTINTSTFTSTAGMMPFYVGSSLHSPFARTKVGIELNSVDDITIGPAAQPTLHNSFSNMDLGIVSNNSVLHSKNNWFNNIRRITTCAGGFPTQPPCAPEGICIYAKSSNPSHIVPIVEVGGSSSDANKFTDVDDGVNVEGTHTVDIGYNSFSNLKRGVYINRSVSTNMDVYYNTLDQFTTGIWAINNPYCDIQIKFNTFNGTYAVISPGTAIRTEEPLLTFGMNPLFHIHDNVIRRVRTGIQATNLLMAEINNYNDIMFEPNHPNTWNASYGIRVQNNYRPLVENNTVYRGSNNFSNTTPTATYFPGISSASDYQNKLIGISMEKCDFGNIFNNTTGYLGTGIRNFASYTANTYSCNVMAYCQWMLWLDNSDPGQQGDATTSQGNQWRSDPNTGFTVQYDAFGPAPTPLNQQWFFNPINIEYVPQVIFPLGLIAAQSASNPNTNCSYPSIIGNDPYNTQKQLAELLLWTKDENCTLSEQAKFLALVEIYKELLYNNSLMSLGTSYDALLQEFFNDEAETNVGIMASVRFDIDSKAYEDASDKNSTITPENLAAANEKATNEIYLATWAKDIYMFTQNQYNSLSGIANQNPISGGPAVYTARVMLGVDFDDFGDLNRLSTVSSSKESFMHIYPNPANTELNLEYSLAENESGVFTLTDITGREVFRQVLNPGIDKATISTKSLEQGVYLAQIRINNGPNISEKLLIAR